MVRRDRGKFGFGQAFRIGNRNNNDILKYWSAMEISSDASQRQDGKRAPASTI
jgi:hypothetical protein